MTVDKFISPHSVYQCVYIVYMYNTTHSYFFYVQYFIWRNTPDTFSNVSQTVDTA